MDAAASPMRSDAHRLGGGLLLGGTLAWLLLSGLHGDLPSTGHHEVAEALRTFWRPIHILTIIAIAVVAAGLALLGGSLASPRAMVLARAGIFVIIPSGAVLGVGYAIDGFVIADLAQAVATAPDQAAREMTLMQASLLLKVVEATSFSFQSLFGLGIALLAGAMLISGEYPRWPCGLGLLGGAIWVLGGVLLFSRVAGIGSWVMLIPVLPVGAFLLGVGWLAWRHGSTAMATDERVGAGSHPAL